MANFTFTNRGDIIAANSIEQNFCAVTSSGMVCASYDDNTAEFMRSTDGGVEWAAVTLPLPIDLSHMTSIGSLMFAIGTTATSSDVKASLLMSSDGGATWSEPTLPSGNFLIFPTVASGAGKLVLAAQNQATFDVHAFISTDNGVTWVSHIMRSYISGQAFSGVKIAYGSGIFVAVPTGASAGSWYTSANAETWTHLGGTGVYHDSTGTTDFAYGAGKFLHIASDGYDILDPGTLAWSAGTLPETIYYLRWIKWVEGAASLDGFVAAAWVSTPSNTAGIVSSTDGTTWVHEDLTGLSVSDEAYLAIGNSGSKLLITHTDAWTADLIVPINTEVTDAIIASSVTGSFTLLPSIVDAMTVGWAMSAIEVVSASSGIAHDDVLTASRTALSTVAESIVMTDAIRLLVEAVVADAFVFSDVVSGTPLITVAVVDTLRMIGLAETSVRALADLSDAMALVSSIRSVFDEAITDTAQIVDLLESNRLAMESIVSGAVFSESLIGTAIITAIVADSLSADDDVTGAASRLATIMESMAFSVSLTLDGVPYVGLALNQANKGVTEYTNYDFNSLANFNGTLYGANSDGLYRLSGDDDAGTPIDAYLRTALTRMAGGKEKRADSAYLGYRSDGTLQLKVVVTGARGQKVGYVYDLVEQVADASRAGRIKLGRGMKSVYWAFELANTDGSDFALDVIEVRPLILDRRIP